MNVVHKASDLQRGSRKVCVAIGVFDGIHLGHQQVIRQTISDAEQHEGLPVAITFDRHPNAVVAPERTPLHIYPDTKKLRVIASLGIETTLKIQFDHSFSRISAEDFIRGLARDFKNIHSICVGSNFTFGHKRQGNVDLLRKLGQELHFTVHGLAAIALDGQRVSSTRIREAICSGNLDLASQMLGRAYSLSGTIIEGDQLGRKLGFPTANIDVHGLILPPKGVYAIHAQTGERLHRAVLNIGVRPTVAAQEPQLRVEAHLLDFSGNLYGQEMEITFVEKLRDEQKFSSAEHLQQQIKKDVEAAKKLF